MFLRLRPNPGPFSSRKEVQTTYEHLYNGGRVIPSPGVKV